VELRQLRYFVRIAELGSLSRAAQVLHVAQPALSQHVAQLESELGHRLLVRRSTGVQLTEQGAILYRHAQRILGLMGQVRDAVNQSVDQPTGTVAVGLPQSTACQYAMPLLEAVSARHPGVALEFFDEISGNLLRGVDSGRLDLAVIVSDEDAALLDAVPVMDETLFLVSRHDLAPAGAAMPLAGLAGLPLALPGPEHGVRARVDASLRGVGAGSVAPKVVANSMNIMRQAVLAGLAHTILPWGAVSEEIERGLLAATPLEPALGRRVWLCTGRGVAPTSAGRAVFALLLELMRSRVRDGLWKGVALLPP
jgi:LysR family nitrogen assimilation transcriptional regulator